MPRGNAPSTPGGTGGAFVNIDSLFYNKRRSDNFFYKDDLLSLNCISHHLSLKMCHFKAGMVHNSPVPVGYEWLPDIFLEKNIGKPFGQFEGFPSNSLGASVDFAACPAFNNIK